jgi:hypothetical protein
MCPSNFKQRHRKLTDQRRAIMAQLDQLGIPRSDDERQLWRRLDKEDEKLWTQIRDLEDSVLDDPACSRHTLANKLDIIRDRVGLSLPIKDYVDRLQIQIRAWRKAQNRRSGAAKAA